MQEQHIRICVFNYREFDEAVHFQNIAAELGVALVITEQAPVLDSLEIAKGCDAISIITTPIDEAMIDRLCDLQVRMISTRTVGVDHIAVEYARERGIFVSNATYPPQGVAEYALMLMMMAARKMKQITARAAIQDYSLEGLIGQDFSGMTVGIVGTGKIAAALITRLRGFGNRILVCGNYRNEEIAQHAEYVSLAVLLAEADIISLHAAYDDTKRHMIDRDAIQQMKPQVILVNTARGALIDTEALIEGIESGKIAAVALDVLENEEALYYHNRSGDVLTDRQHAILKSFPNVIVTPHMAFYTEDSVRNMIASSLKSCLYELTGQANPWKVC
ncbi:MAG: NAD(P)-dependent oxidoreductase [Lachnospiraceae bacterium]